jgi:hypothetical protein
MVQKNQNSDDLFNQLAEEQPIRDTEESVDASYDNDDRPLEYYERNTPNLTDLQFLIKTLSPDFKDEVFNCLLVGRLSPDTFRPLFRLLVNNEIRRHRGKQIDVIKTATKIYTILTIALDGKHVIDILEIYGSKSSNDELDNISKNMGLGG